jgi:hypothetical protein
MTENKADPNITEIFDIVEIEDTTEQDESIQLDTLSEEILQFFEIEERKAS